MNHGEEGVSGIMMLLFWRCKVVDITFRVANFAIRAGIVSIFRHNRVGHHILRSGAIQYNQL